MIRINSCYGIGYKCTTDDFMIGLNIRKQSSPFSYMVCDLETSLNFINNEFNDFLNVISKPAEHNFHFNGNKWNHHLYFNHTFFPGDDRIEITELKRICVWNHHDLNNSTTLEAIKRRYTRLLNDDKELHKNILYIYIENVQVYTTDNWEDYFTKEGYYIKGSILNFMNTQKNRYMLLFLPLLNFNKEPRLYKVNESMNVVFYQSSLDGAGNERINTKIDWNTLNDLVLKSYIFDM